MNNGTILTLSPTWYLVQRDNQDVYFLHKNDIKQGTVTFVGQPVTFDIADRLPGGRYPRAVRAVVGDTSENGGIR